MELNKIKSLIRNLGSYTLADLEEFTFMSEEELNSYQDNLETDDGDNLSCWDHIRATLTLKKRIEELEATLKSR